MKNKSTNTIKNGKWYSIWSIKNNKTGGCIRTKQNPFGYVLSTVDSSLQWQS